MCPHTKLEVSRSNGANKIGYRKEKWTLTHSDLKVGHSDLLFVLTVGILHKYIHAKLEASRSNSNKMCHQRWNLNVDLCDLEK